LLMRNIVRQDGFLMRFHAVLTTVKRVDAGVVVVHYFPRLRIRITSEVRQATKTSQLNQVVG
jgi:hypothetical protein